MVRTLPNINGVAIEARYLVARLAGAGGMSAVFEATDMVTNRRVALKILLQDLSTNATVVSRFRREARIVESLKSPFIAEFIGTGFLEGRPYIAMEFLEGRTLDDLVQKEAPLPTQRAAQIAVQVLSGLQAAHEKQVIHRDVKPHNIFLVSTDRAQDVVKLLDFGVAKLRTVEDEQVSSLTDTGAVLGTPGYMSPEQAVGAKAVSARSDIYSVGVVLYQMLCGQLPFKATNRNALLVQILAAAPLDLGRLNPSVPEEMCAIVRTAMARNPSRRFESCADFRERLLPFASGTCDTVELREPPATAEPSQRGAIPGQVKRVHDVVFVGLHGADNDIVLETGDVARVRNVETVDGLGAALRDGVPGVIVAACRVDLDALTHEFPGFRAPVVTIDALRFHEELSIHEWSEPQGRHAERRAGLSDLDREINDLCGRGNAPPASPRKALDQISFANLVESNGSHFRVSTEVVDRDPIRVRTIAWCGGQAVGSKTSQMDRTESYEAVAHAAQTQHNAALDAVLHGKSGL
jgi:serine/threonine-protein kinase